MSDPILSPVELELRRLLRRAERADRRTISECQGKVTFATFEEAHRVATRRRNTDGARTARVAYRCHACHQYHVGHRHDPR
jgi:hypothetical protein